MSNKINYVELTGNLVSDAREADKATYVTIATWNGKDMNGEDRPATFTDIVFFKKKDFAELTKGKRVTIKGRLANYKDKETHYNRLGVIGLSYVVIEKKQEQEPIESYKAPTKEEVEKEVPWELDL